MANIGILLLGVVFAGVGGELFVRAAVGIARWARVPPGIIGATIAAFATSSPEFSVSLNAAISGSPEIALGDALGSNVSNVGLILGLALLISSIEAKRDSIKRDFPVAALVPLVTALLAVDGVLSRIDGALMFGLFLTWLVTAAVEARRQRSAASDVLGEKKHWRAVVEGIAGMALLVAAGILIVSGAKGIAFSFGLDTFVVGATIVAIGTSTPELATTIIAKMRGHDDVGLGTVLGSNIFNGFWIVSCAAMINPDSTAFRGRSYLIENE